MNKHLNPRLRRLHQLYTDPQSPVFLEKNINRLLKFTKNDPNTQILTKDEILRYQESLSLLSKSRENRILRGRRRYVSYRRWRTFSPGHIMLADLAFVKSIRKPQKMEIILIFLDAYSR